MLSIFLKKSFAFDLQRRLQPDIRHAHVVVAAVATDHGEIAVTIAGLGSNHGPERRTAAAAAVVLAAPTLLPSPAIVLVGEVVAQADLDGGQLVRQTWLEIKKGQKNHGNALG